MKMKKIDIWQIQYCKFFVRRPVVPRGSNLSFRLRALIMYERGGKKKKGHSHLWQTRIPAGRWVTLGRSRRRQSSPAPRRPWEARRTTTPPRCSRAWSHAEPDGRGHISAKRRQEESPRHLSQWGETKKKELNHTTHAWRIWEATQLEAIVNDITWCGMGLINQQSKRKSKLGTWLQRLHDDTLLQLIDYLCKLLISIFFFFFTF